MSISLTKLSTSVIAYKNIVDTHHAADAKKFKTQLEKVLLKEIDSVLFHNAEGWSGSKAFEPIIAEHIRPF